MTKQIHLFKKIDSYHIPYVDDDEQKEIEGLLKNEDCHIYGSKSIYEFDFEKLVSIKQIKTKKSKLL